MLTAKFIREVKVEESTYCTGSLIRRVDAPNGNACQLKEPDEAFKRKNRGRNAFWWPLC